MLARWRFLKPDLTPERPGAGPGEIYRCRWCGLAAAYDHGMPAFGYGARQIKAERQKAFEVRLCYQCAVIFTMRQTELLAAAELLEGWTPLHDLVGDWILLDQVTVADAIVQVSREVDTLEVEVREIAERLCRDGWEGSWVDLRPVAEKLAWS